MITSKPTPIDPSGHRRRFVPAGTDEDGSRAAGHVGRRPVPNVRAAIDAIDQQKVEAAILDINLGKENSFPVAHALKERGIPFVFITGYGDLILDDKLLEGHALFRKPIRMDTLSEAVRRFG